jgi:CDP-paratose 2-epimerase
MELCKTWRSGFILLSTSRVYSIQRLSELPLEVVDDAFVLRSSDDAAGFTEGGISEKFSTEPPLSLYGTSKRASELLALEYGEAFGFPVFINRCGVLAGAGQFGKIDQGIFSFWIHSYARKRPLKYIGFDGTGHQVRDCLHARDLLPLILRQMKASSGAAPKIINVSGGSENSASLKQLSAWCSERFGAHHVEVECKSRPFDIPWLVLDNRAAEKYWDWKPQTPLKSIWVEIAEHATKNPQWLETVNDP